MIKPHAFLRVLVLATLVAAAGCQVAPDRTASPKPTDRKPLTPRDDVAIPPGIDPARLRPLTGDALARARTPLDRVLTEIEPPAYLADAPPPADESQTVPANAKGEAEPDLAAQRAYFHGRRAWRRGDRAEAVRQLEEALRLAPDTPAVLHLLGRIYTTSANKVRGAEYLRQAVRLEPSNLESLFLLGRYALDQKEWPQGIALFHRVATLAERRQLDDPTIARLARFYLSEPLSQSGYVGAAIEQLRAYLEDAEAIRRDTPFAREFLFIYRQRGETWQALGDLYHQMNRPDEALAAYESAREAGVSDELGLIKRLVYTHLRRGDDEAAQAPVLARLTDARADDETLALVRYLAEQAVATDRLAEALRGVYEREQRPASMALAISEVLPSSQAEAWLLEHLSHRPGDVEVVEVLLRRWLLPNGASSVSTQRLTRAIRVTARAMEASPREAEGAAVRLMRAAGDLAALSAGFEELEPAERDDALMRVLEGMVWAGRGESEEAERLFEAAMREAPELALPRIELSKLMIATRRLDRAARVLEPVANEGDPRVASLRVIVLTQSGKEAEALALIDRLIVSEEADTPLYLQKAQLHLRTNDVEAAEQTLLDAVNRDPKNERLYEALFQLYDPPDGRARVSDAQAQYQRLMRRMLGEIPNSRLARIKRAEVHVARRQYDEAIALLGGLLDENPNDMVALKGLLEAYVRGNRRDEATALLDQRLERDGDNRTLLMLAMEFYRQTQNLPRMRQVQERLLELQPDSLQKRLALAGLYINTDRADRAIEMLDEALRSDDVDNPLPVVRMLATALVRSDRRDEIEPHIDRATERFPEHEADLRYLHAAIVSQLGDQDRAERLMVRVIERFPDHPATNNDLGYSWTVQHRRLEEAKRMIQKAVDADPDNEAYLDSMGWVLYKLGEFADAEKWLRRATDEAERKASRGADNAGTRAVVADHLGDALYRLGRQAEAVRAWSTARSRLREVDTSGDPELEGLERRLEQKIEAVRQQRPAPVAEVPGETEAANERAGDEPVRDEAGGVRPRAMGEPMQGESR